MTDLLVLMRDDANKKTKCRLAQSLLHANVIGTFY
jgi:hypothetical protein